MRCFGFIEVKEFKYFVDWCVFEVICWLFNFVLMEYIIISDCIKLIFGLNKIVNWIDIL